MGQNFLSCDRGQAMLLPASVADWLPEGHLARFVVEVVERLDLAAFYGVYRADGSGRPAHDPAMMVALVLFNYAVGVRSSRVIERRCVEDVACRFIAANRAPDHVTINRFRSRHQDALSDLFADVLGLCARAGMVEVGTIAIDSTKMAADASLGQTRTLEGLRAEAERIIGEAVETDRAEDELYGDRRGDELPAELADPRTRAGRIRELLDELEREREQIDAEETAKREAYESKVKAGKRPAGRPFNPGTSTRQDALFARKVNVTDPDSRIVRDRGKRIQGYNVQVAVAAGQVILATDACSSANDQAQLEPMVAAARKSLRASGITDDLEHILADSGYWNTGQIRGLQDERLEVLVTPRRSGASPANQALQEDMLARLDHPDGAAAYRRRQQIVEPVFAHIKYLRGITRLLRRGRAAVQAEIDLIATSHNLLKLYRAAPHPA